MQLLLDTYPEVDTDEKYLGRYALVPLTPDFIRFTLARMVGCKALGALEMTFPTEVCVFLKHKGAVLKLRDVETGQSLRKRMAPGLDGCLRAPDDFQAADAVRAPMASVRLTVTPDAFWLTGYEYDVYFLIHSPRVPRTALERVQAGERLGRIDTPDGSEPDAEDIPF